MLQSRNILNVVQPPNQTSQQYMSTPNIISIQNAGGGGAGSGISHLSPSPISLTATTTPSSIVVDHKHVITHQPTITSTNSATTQSTNGGSSSVEVPMSTTLVSAHESHLLHHHQHHVHHHVNQAPGTPLLLSSSGHLTPTSTSGTLLANNPQNVRPK